MLSASGGTLKPQRKASAQDLAFYPKSAGFERHRLAKRRKKRPRAGPCSLPCLAEGAWERARWQGDGLILPRHIAQLPPGAENLSLAGETEAVLGWLRTPQCWQAVCHCNTASLRCCAPSSVLCPELSPGQGHMQEHPWPSSPIPGSAACALRLSGPHPGASRQSYALTPSTRKEITLVCGYFFSPLLAGSAGCFAGCLYSQG